MSRKIPTLGRLGPSLTPRSRRRTYFVIAVAAVMYASVFAFRMATANVNDTVGILYIWPIVLLAVELGIGPALIGAALAYGLFITWAEIQDVSVTPIGYVARVAVFFPTALVVGAIATRLRVATERARSSAEEMQSMVSFLSDALVSADDKSRIVGWNPAAERTFGWRSEEVLGSDVAEVAMPERLRSAYREALRRFLETGDRSMIGTRFEFRGLRKDGTEFPIEMTVSAVESSDGWVFNAFAHDISARKEEERARGHLAAVVESSQDAIYTYTPDGRILTWNHGAEGMYGYSAAEAIGMGIDTLAPPDRPDDTTRIREQVARGERVTNFQTDRIGKEGRSVAVSINASALTGDDGRVLAVATVARDVSEARRRARYESARHRATRVLAEAPAIEELGPTLLPTIADAGNWLCAAYWTADPETRTLHCAHTWTAPRTRARVLPFAENHQCEISAKPTTEIAWYTDDARVEAFPCGDQAARAGMHTQVWAPIVVGGETVGAFHLMDRRSREREDALIAVLTAITSQAGSYLERTRADRELERAKDEFFAQVSHELRTPLTSIIGYADLLAEDAAAMSEEGREYLEVVRRNAEREMRLVGDLLLLVRISEGTFDIERELTDFRRIVQEAVESARPAADRREIALASEAARAVPLTADPHRLGQAVDNLLSNAIKFTSPGGRVDVRLTAQNGAVALEVEDNGAGIPAAELNRLFDRLYRASSATADHIPGLGLGLTIVQAIVEAHGGTIRVESTEGVGTTFRIELPQRKEAQA